MLPTNTLTRRIRFIALMLIASCVLSSCSEEEINAGAVPAPGPDLIVFHKANLQPEGIEYDAGGERFVVGSRTEGTIHTVDDAGNIDLLVANPGLTSSLGMQIDEQRLVVAGTIGTATIGLGIYDLETGAVLQVVDLSAVAGAGGHLANDVALDHDGNAYVTDTLAPVLYRVTPDGQAGRFAEDARFTLLNGIAFHPNGYLIVATITGPHLLRVRIDAPDEVTEVETPFSVTGDGIAFRSDGVLAVVSNALAADGTVIGPGVTLFRSEDDWQSAVVAGSWVATDTPTTAAVRGGDVHVIYAHLFDPTRTEYEIVKALFDEQ